MSSTLYNSAALSALQALNMTQQSLNIVQNQVSTGLAVATAADNSSYWSVAAELNQDNGIVTASNTALTEGESMLSTASSAISSVITTLNSMATALTEAQTPNANITAINTSLASLGQELTDAVGNASFNGLNILNGTVTTTVGATSATGVNFVSGYNATSNGGTVNTIGMATQVVYGDETTATTGTAVTGNLTLAQASTLTFGQATPATGVLNAFKTAATTTAPTTLSLATPTATKAAPFTDNADSTDFIYTTQQYNTNGSITQTSYTAVDSAGQTVAGAPPTSPPSRPRAASRASKCRPRPIRRWEPRRVS